MSYVRRIVSKLKPGSVFIESALQDLSLLLVSVLFALSAIHQPPWWRKALLPAPEPPLRIPAGCRGRAVSQLPTRACQFMSDQSCAPQRGVFTLQFPIKGKLRVCASAGCCQSGAYRRTVERCDSALFHGRMSDLWLNRDKSNIEMVTYLSSLHLKKVIYCCCIVKKKTNPPALLKACQNSDKQNQLQLFNSWTEH